MVQFNLQKAHPEYQEKIEALIKGLLAKYPFTKLKAVSLFDPDKKVNDLSMGRTTPQGEITLNSYWFSQPPEFLQKSAQEKTEVDIGGNKVPWHGEMIEEPEHVITHEFGHVIALNLPGWKKFAETRRKQILKDTALAISAYECADDDELFAEDFAAYELGFADKDLQYEMDKLLSNGS